MLGTVLAWNDWVMMRKYAGTAEGLVVQYHSHLCIDSPDRPPTSQIPAPRMSAMYDWYEVQYAFVVNGKTYYSVDRNCPRLVHRVPIHYDPHDPATNIRGSLTSPWSVLAVTLAIGGFLVFIGYDLARKGRQSNSQHV